VTVTAAVLAFVVGLLSTLHCIGMCGAIAGAMTYSLPSATRAVPRRLAAYVLAYNFGRIGSYAVAGAALGAFGAGLAHRSMEPGLFEAVRWLAASLLVGVGLYIGGWFPRFVQIERLGAPIWRWLEPLGRRRLPVRSLPSAVVVGAVWGWLPCGLVYSMLLSAPAQSGVLSGALYMGLFGLGTLPAVAGSGLFAGQLYRLAQNQRYQRMAGLLVIALALLTFVAER
jgi:sulfite exporter TauE/SafE